MPKLTGQEGKFISDELFETLVKNYQELHGAEPSYVKRATLSFEQVQKAMVPGATNFHVYNGYDGHRTVVILVPVSQDGKEFPATILPENQKENTSSSSVRLADDPPFCPPYC